MWSSYRRWATSPQGFLALAILCLINAELDYGRHAKTTALVFLLLGVALGVRAGFRWRGEKRDRQEP